MNETFLNLAGLALAVAGVLLALSAWRWDRIAFAPYMEAPYWEKRRRIHRRAGRILGLMLLAVVTLAFLFGVPWLTPLNAGLLVFVTAQALRFEILARRIGSLLETEAAQASSDRSRLTSKA